MFNIIYYDLQFSNKENILLNIYFINFCEVIFDLFILTINDNYIDDY